MSEATAFDTHVANTISVKIPRPLWENLTMTQPSLKREFDYYLSNQDRLVAEYNGKCIVIKDQQIIGAYNDYREAVVESIKQGHEAGTFLTQRVSPGSADYTGVFHSRVAFN